MIRVLVVDDSSVVRSLLARELGRAPDITVVGKAEDAYVAREKIAEMHPDVITLDLEMPRMNGLIFLAKLMKHYPLPVIVVSAVTPKGSEKAIRALELGAFEVVAKPEAISEISLLSSVLIENVRAAAHAGRLKRRGRQHHMPSRALGDSLRDTTHKLLAIGASTGGVTALREILPRLPHSTPGTLIVQHMPKHFTTVFANRVNEICAMEVREAERGDRVVPGVALVAPGGHHMVLRPGTEGYVVDINGAPPVHRQRPSADVLFDSVASYVGSNATGVLLTGMGADGAEGLLAMRQAGAHTFAQDEDSCVVFGMPEQAIRIGAAENVVSLSRMPERILRTFAERPLRAGKKT